MISRSESRSDIVPWTMRRRQEREADLERVVAQDPLQVERAEEEHPEHPDDQQRLTMFAPATLRERNRRSGISGLAMRAWRTTNAASSATDTAPSPSVWVEPQPCSPRLRIV